MCLNVNFISKNTRNYHLSFPFFFFNQTIRVVVMLCVTWPLLGVVCSFTTLRHWACLIILYVSPKGSRLWLFLTMMELSPQLLQIQIKHTWVKRFTLLFSLCFFCFSTPIFQFIYIIRIRICEMKLIFPFCNFCW